MGASYQHMLASAGVRRNLVIDSFRLSILSKTVSGPSL